MKDRGRVLFPIVAAALAAAAAWIYRQRPRERIASPESLDDPEVARAFGWVASMPQMRLVRRLVAARAVQMVSEGAAVDLGCGPGQLVITLASQAPDLHVTGVDLSDDMLIQSDENARRAGLADRVSFRPGDAQQIPFPDGSLDLIVSTMSLHHWNDPVAVLDEVARVVRRPEPGEGRPGGSFLIVDLRRDMPPPGYLLLWFATHVVVPAALRRVNEPLGSRNAAYTLQEAMELAAHSHLTGWRVTAGPFWLTIEGTISEDTVRQSA
jgi:ubiquinone/menaquinone biosynthesis C-methylase UbiE